MQNKESKHFSNFKMSNAIFCIKLKLINVTYSYHLWEEAKDNFKHIKVGRYEMNKIIINFFCLLYTIFEVLMVPTSNFQISQCFQKYKRLITQKSLVRRSMCSKRNSSSLSVSLPLNFYHQASQ